MNVLLLYWTKIDSNQIKSNIIYNSMEMLTIYQPIKQQINHPTKQRTDRSIDRSIKITFCLLQKNGEKELFFFFKKKNYRFISFIEAKMRFYRKNALCANAELADFIFICSPFTVSLQYHHHYLFMFRFQLFLRVVFYQLNFVF